MEQVDSEESNIASRLARGEMIVHPHDKSKTDSVSVAQWRQKVIRECEGVDVPYSFHVDLLRGVTVAINPQHHPSEADLEARIAEVGQTYDGNRDDVV